MGRGDFPRTCLTSFLGSLLLTSLGREERDLKNEIGTGVERLYLFFFFNMCANDTKLPDGIVASYIMLRTLKETSLVVLYILHGRVS